MTDADLAALAAPLLLATAAVIATLLALPARVGARLVTWLAAAAALGGAVTAIAIGVGPSGAGGAVVRDGASVFLVALVAVCGAATLALAAAGGRPSKDEPGLILFSACGAAVVVSAADLVVLFVGLALLTLPLYALTARRDDAVRHLVLGATGTAVAIYGVALLYAATGDTAYGMLGRATHNPLYLGGLALVLGGVGAHAMIALAERWSVIVNIGIVGALLRLAAATRNGEAAVDWEVSFAVIAAVALTVSGVAALTETRLRRLVGYATLTQLGYVALAAAGAGGPAAAFGLAVYAALAIGLLAILSALPSAEPALADLAGLARRRPLLALSLAVAVLGVIGLPPAAGFLAKVYVFESAVRAQLLWLVAVGTLASVVSIAAYVRVVLACLAPPSLDAIAPPRARVATAIAVIAGLALLIGGVLPGPALDAAQAVRF